MCIISLFLYSLLHAETFLKTQWYLFQELYFVLLCLFDWNWGLSLVIMVATTALNPHSLASALTFPGGSAPVSEYRSPGWPPHPCGSPCGHLAMFSPQPIEGLKLQVLGLAMHWSRTSRAPLTDTGHLASRGGRTSWPPCHSPAQPWASWRGLNSCRLLKSLFACHLFIIHTVNLARK